MQSSDLMDIDEQKNEEAITVPDEEMEVVDSGDEAGDSDHKHILTAVGGLKLGKGSGRRGNLSSALRRANNIRRRVQGFDSPRTPSKTLRSQPGTPSRSLRKLERSNEISPYPQPDCRGKGAWKTLNDTPRDGNLHDDERYGHEFIKDANQSSAAIDPGIRHQQLTVVLASYLQLAFNLVLVCVILYSLISFALSVRGDIQLKINEEISSIKNDIARCKFNFYENRCDDVERIVPRMREQCAQWAACAERPPESAAYQTRLTAELFAEVVNSFIEPISYKTMIFTIGVTIAFTVISNLAFYMARSKGAEVSSFSAQRDTTENMALYSETKSGYRTPMLQRSASRNDPYAGGTPSSTPRRLEFI